MHGHGTFVYRPDFTIERFGAATGVADALKAMGMSHAWLRVHNRNGAWRPEANMALACDGRLRAPALGLSAE